MHTPSINPKHLKLELKVAPRKAWHACWWYQHVCHAGAPLSQHIHTSHKAV